jgi:hypothetical protein
VRSGDARRAFFRGSVHGFEEDFEPEFFILLHHLRQAGFIDGESLLPTFLIQFFFSTHFSEPFSPSPYSSPFKGEGEKGFFFEIFFAGHIVNDEQWTINYERRAIH